MNVIIIGGGVVGSTLSRMLSEQNHKVTIVESNINRMEELEALKDADIIYGDGTSATTLVHAGVRDCDYILAMTNDDRSNILACAVGSALGAGKTLARVHDQIFVDTALLNYQLHFNVDRFVDPEALAARELYKKICAPECVEVEVFANGDIQVQSILVDQISNAVGKSVIDLQSEKDGVLVTYVFRDNQFVAITPSLKVQAFDRITFIGRSEALFKIHELLNPEHVYKKCKLFLMGGSEVAVNLIHLLNHSRFEINLIESNKYRCRSLAKNFPHINIIEGDATSRELLEQHIDHANYFVSCTKNDESNFMTALQAIKLGCAAALTVTNKVQYEAILSEFTDKIEKAISPRHEAIKTVFNFISDENFIPLSYLSDGKVRLIEFKVQPKSDIVGKKIMDVAFPKNTVLAVLKHKFVAKIPRDDDTLLAGDHLVMICPSEDMEHLMDFFA